MAFSKIIFNNTTLMDVTDDTVVADKLVTSYTATRSDGVEITGTYTGADISDATATADEIYEGKTAYIATGKATGTADIVHTVSSIPSTKDTSIIKITNTNDYYAWKDDGISPGVRFQIEQKILTISSDPSNTSMISPYEEDFIPGYVDSGTIWKPQDSTNNRSDFYHLDQNTLYCLCLGGTVGSRFRAVAVSGDPSTATGTLAGVFVCNVSTPSAYAYVLFYSSTRTYLAVTKDNESVDGIKTYLVKIGLDVELE